jgi:hypothetical protein
MQSSLNDQLAAVQKAIVEADQRVGDQLGLVETLTQDGHDPAAALDLLATLERSTRILEERQTTIEEQISARVTEAP